MLHFKDHIARCDVTLRITLTDLAADHHLHDLSHVRLRDIPDAYILAVAKDRDPVTELEDLFHSVGDVDDGNALRLQ